MNTPTEQPEQKKQEYRIWLREQRFLRGYDQGEFSKLVGISRSALCQIENGNNKPSPATTREISRVLSEHEIVVPDGVELPALA